MTAARRTRCAADCGQPLTCWNTDAIGRRWHPDCLPPGTPMPKTPEARIAELEAEIERLHEAHLNQPVLRHCVYPGCLREFDMNGTLSGRHIRPSWSGEGWLHVRPVNSYICPEHAPIVGENAHRPQWAHKRGETTPGTLACSCGWTSPPVRWRGYGAEAWKDHLLAVGKGEAQRPITSHTHEGTPGPGNRCEAEAFGETCGALWEQHRMREDCQHRNPKHLGARPGDLALVCACGTVVSTGLRTTVDNPLTSTNTVDNPEEPR